MAPWKWLVGAALALAVCAPLLFRVYAQRPGPTELPVYGRVPDLALTDQHGAGFSHEDLRQSAWIANFIFTRCPTVCPVLTQTMQTLQSRTHELGTDLRLVSFSVDPDYDTPEVLAAYGRKFGADPARWSFVTGPSEALRNTVKEGFKIAVEVKSEGDVPDILHGTHFVLFDRRRDIRGYYASDDAAALDRLVRDATQLAAR